jgi:glutathione-independent formaldehyde dehydrogenase
VSEDPHGADKLAKEGKIAFDLGTFFEKGQHMGTGQANVKAYNRYLCALIHEGRANPSWIVSHEIGLDEAPDGYKNFDHREAGWTKVVLHPGQERRRTGSKEAKETTRSQRRFAHAR